MKFPIVTEVKNLLFPRAGYLEKKWSDHEDFTLLMNFVGIVLGSCFWIWDYVTDPIGAQSTIWLRLTFLLFIANVVGFRLKTRPRFLTAAAIGMTLGGEYIYIEILNRLDMGMVYGIGGFTFFLFLPVTAFIGFSLRSNLAYTLSATALPQLLGALGIAHNFPQLQYAVLLWPAAIITILTQVVFAHNYRHRYELHKSLEMASNTDPLTGASNRRHFIPCLDQEMDRSQRLGHQLSLLMIDIDNFKKINDTRGHPAGDLVICKLADICAKTLRRIDAVARLGGDEFAVLMFDTDYSGALVAAEHIRKAVECARVTGADGREFQFTISIGAATRRIKHRTGSDLLADADRMLYEAKQLGRNTVWPAVNGRETVYL
jgi:diguanylate cyclase (GGDEF)-like protein